MDKEIIIRGLEETETILKQAVDRGGEMSLMKAYKCECHVSDALVLLKEQEKRIKDLEHTLETLTRWRMNAGAFD